MPTDELYLEPQGEPEFLSEKPVRESIRVKRAPDAAAVGRGTLRNSGKVVVILYEDLESYKEKTLLVAGAGDYLAEYCVDGRTQRAWPFHVDARQQSTVVNPSEPLRTQPDSEVDARLARIEHALLGRRNERPRNRARRVERAFRRYAAREQDSSTNKDELYREMMEREREYNRETRERDRAYFEERIKMLSSSEQKENHGEADERSALMLLLEDDRVRQKAVSSVSRWLDPDAAQQKHPLVETAEIIFDNSDKLVPLAQAASVLLSSLFKRPAPPNSAPPQFQQQPAPQFAPQPLPPAPLTVTQQAVGTVDEETTKTLEFVLGECKDNAPARRSARSVVWLLDTFPQETAPLAVLLNLPGESICSMLAAQLSQVPEAIAVLQMEHAPAWFDGLRDAVAKRRNVKAVAPSDNSLEAEETAEAKTA